MLITTTIGNLCKETFFFVLFCYEEIWKQTTIILKELQEFKLYFKKREQEKERCDKIMIQSIQEIKAEVITLKQKNKIFEELLYAIHAKTNQLLLLEHENKITKEKIDTNNICNINTLSTSLSSSSIFHPIFHQTFTVHNNNNNNTLIKNEDENNNNAIQVTSKSKNNDNNNNVQKEIKKIPYQANFYVKDKAFINFINKEMENIDKNQIENYTDDWDGIIIVRHQLDGYLTKCTYGIYCRNIEENCRYIHGNNFDHRLILFSDPIKVIPDMSTGFVSKNTDTWQKLNFFVLNDEIIPFRKLIQFMSTRRKYINNFSGDKNIFFEETYEFYNNT